MIDIESQAEFIFSDNFFIMEYFTERGNTVLVKNFIDK